jgi:hypothetical protein
MKTMSLVEASRQALLRAMARDTAIFVLGEDVRQGAFSASIRGLPRSSAPTVWSIRPLPRRQWSALPSARR